MSREQDIQAILKKLSWVEEHIAHINKTIEEMANDVYEVKKMVDFLGDDD